MIGESTHVIRLAPAEQLALRYLMLNIYSGWVDKAIKEVGGMDDVNFINSKSSTTLVIFTRMNQLLDFLPTRHNFSKYKDQVLYLQPLMMTYINSALAWYDPTRNYLASDERPYVDVVLQSLKEKIGQSSLNKYTKEEIANIGRKRG